MKKSQSRFQAKKSQQFKAFRFENLKALGPSTVSEDKIFIAQ